MKETLEMKRDRLVSELAFDYAVQQWEAIQAEIKAFYMPPGAYRARITSVEFFLDDDDQACLNILFEILEGGNQEGRQVPYTVYFNEEEALIMCRTLLKLGIALDDLSTARDRDFSRETWTVYIKDSELDYRKCGYVHDFFSAEDEM